MNYYCRERCQIGYEVECTYAPLNLSTEYLLCVTSVFRSILHNIAVNNVWIALKPMLTRRGTIMVFEIAPTTQPTSITHGLNSTVQRAGHNVLHYILHCSMLTYLLTPWYRVLPEQLTGLQLVKKSPHFTEPEISLPHSQAYATCLYPEPAQSSPYTHIPPPGDPSQYYPHIYA